MAAIARLKSEPYNDQQASISTRCNNSQKSNPEWKRQVSSFKEFTLQEHWIDVDNGYHVY